MSALLVDLRAAQVRAAQLADLSMIRQLADIARRDREEHARYRVYRTEIVGMRRQEVTVACDLSYADARRVADGLDRSSRAERPNDTSWTRPLHFVQMEPRSCLVEVPSGYMTDALLVLPQAAAA